MMIQHYKNLIIQKDYFKAHEALEELWFTRRFEDNPEVKILKGFINAAVSFELHKRKRYTQSKYVWKNYLKYRNLLFFSLEESKRSTYYELSRFIESHHAALNEEALYVYKIGLKDNTASSHI
jgi:hypothetical protein